MIGIPFSRVYLGVHFPTDLLGGYLIGAFLLILFIYLLPYLENANAYQALDLDVPMYGIDFQISKANRTAVAARIAEFLCPSDHGASDSPNLGPTNYAASAGTGTDGGSPYQTDGLFYVNSAKKSFPLSSTRMKAGKFSTSIL